jgi:hypothetical protein
MRGTDSLKPTVAAEGAANSPRRTARGRWSQVLAPLLLALFTLQVLFGIRTLSTVTDESVDVAAGYSYWTTRDARMNFEHPALIKLWLALPLLPLHLATPTQDRTWRDHDETGFTRVFLYRDPNQVERIILVARIPILLIGVLLAAMTWKWATELWGSVAGGVALFLLAFDPTILANSGLATMDLGLAAFTFLSMYYLWKWLGSGRRNDGLLAGVMLGGALLSKYTALAFLPIVLAETLLYPRKVGTPASTRFTVGLVAFLQVATVAIVVVIGVYAVVFNWHPLLRTGAEHRAVRAALARIPGVSAYRPRIIDLAQRMWVPDVESYIRGALDQRDHLIAGDPIAVMGRVSPRGVWYYYPLALLLKTPIPILLLVLLRLALRPRLPAVPAESFLMLPVVSLVFLACFSTVDLGIRYLLPAYPFCYVWLSRTAMLVASGTDARG